MGETIEWTWRMRVTQAGTQVPDDLTHGIGWGSMAVPNDFAVMYFYTQPGRWRPEIYVADTTATIESGLPHAWSKHSSAVWDKALLADVWYDFTVGFERTATSAFRPTIEVRETNGKLIASTPDFHDWPLKGSTGLSLATKTLPSSKPGTALEYVGFLNGLTGQNSPVTWCEVDFVRGVRR